MTRLRLVAVPLLIFASTVASGTATQSAERVCRSALGAIRVDNVRVPRNATCDLNGTLVRGNIKVETRATLLAKGVMVIGDIQGDGARNLSVIDQSRVGGSVQIKLGGSASVEDSRIDNNIHYDQNRALVRLLRSHVGGNVQATKNTGGVEIAGNAINGNLQCTDNNPAPVGADNIVGGNKQDQCAGL